VITIEGGGRFSAVRGASEVIATLGDQVSTWGGSPAPLDYWLSRLRRVQPLCDERQVAEPTRIISRAGTQPGGSSHGLALRRRWVASATPNVLPTSEWRPVRGLELIAHRHICAV
jgi:hypothetical protein